MAHQCFHIGPISNWWPNLAIGSFWLLIGRLTGPAAFCPAAELLCRPMALAREEIPAESCIDLVGKLDLLTGACLARVTFMLKTTLD